MNTKTLHFSAMIIALGFAAAPAVSGSQPTGSFCTATMDLFPNRAGDKIRVRNQAPYDINAQIRLVNTLGKQQGAVIPLKSFDGGSSVVYTVQEIFTRAGIRTVNSSFLVEIAQLGHSTKTNGWHYNFHGWIYQPELIGRVDGFVKGEVEADKFLAEFNGEENENARFLQNDWSFYGTVEETLQQLQATYINVSVPMAIPTQFTCSEEPEA